MPEQRGAVKADGGTQLQKLRGGFQLLEIFGFAPCIIADALRTINQPRRTKISTNSGCFR